MDSPLKIDLSSGVLLVSLCVCFVSTMRKIGCTSLVNVLKSRRFIFISIVFLSLLGLALESLSLLCFGLKPCIKHGFYGTCGCLEKRASLLIKLFLDLMIRVKPGLLCRLCCSFVVVFCLLAVLLFIAFLSCLGSVFPFIA